MGNKATKPSSASGGSSASGEVSRASIFARRPFPCFFIILAALLAVLFHKSFHAGLVHFSNDAPLGAYTSQWVAVPACFFGVWDDLNTLGFNAGAWPVSLSQIVRMFLGAVWYSKVYVPITLLFIGCCAWVFFRTLKLRPMACALGGFAAALNSGYFSASCWGVGTLIVAFGFEFLAFAAVVTSEQKRRWLMLPLAGLAVGMGIVEGVDLGAIFSLVLAAFVVFQALMGGGGMPGRLGKGVVRTALVAICAALIAASTIVALVGTQIKGIAGTQQDTRTKQERWDWATQWSFSKVETFGLIVPGLFGYRMDTPDGGNYWGKVGRDPAWDRYFKGGKQGAPPPGFMRFSGGGNYEGVLAVLVGLWAVCQGFRRKDSIFDESQRKLIWFWSAALVISLLLAYGRFAPFYQCFYALPYFSTIRNPGKFLHVAAFGLITLFAYGVDGLWRRHIEGAVDVVGPLGTRIKTWWSKVSGFDRRWTIGCGIALGVSLLGWLIYGSSSRALEQYLQGVQFDNEAVARSIASFSIRQVGWFVLFLALGVAATVLILSGAFAGRRARWAGVLLGLLLVVDLARANQPWIVYWDYQQKYATNPIIEVLRQKPWEHRVAILPFRSPPELRWLNELYRIEWAQHHFVYYDVQSLDVIQMPRMPEDLGAFELALQFDNTTNTIHRIARRWELTNTRYLLGATGFIDVLNQQIDAGRNRFRIAAGFDIVPKPGVANPSKLEELTAVLSTNGQYALFEFTGALPRAKLYSNWLVSTNDRVTLQKLADPGFDPRQQVLLAEAPAVTASPTTNNPPEAAVQFARYTPKDMVFDVRAEHDSVMLLNDKFDASWKVLVDGRQKPMLRANYIMRGVGVPAGKHEVRFVFAPEVWPLYISLGAMAVGLVLLGLVFTAPAVKPAPSKPENL